MILLAGALALGAPAGAAVPAALVAASSAPAADWKLQRSPHFDLRYESRLPPSGMTLELEKIHNRLRLDLGMMAPWLAERRIQVYLYSSAETYKKGEFQPPPWSNGISLSERFVLASFEQEREKMLRILAHEATHLLFEGYFREGRPGRSVHASTGAARGDSHEPPLWLDEGLAMTMENSVSFTSEDNKDNVWLQLMRNLKTPLSISVFLAHTPGADESPEKVQAWYVQAFALTRFLFREHARGQFKTFCALLREGKPVEKALWDAYRFRDLAALDAAWRRWMKLPEDASAGSEGPPGTKRLIPVSFSTPTFR